ncbi:MAG: DrmE family protein [Rhodothermus sp.]|nr:DrmE family protein [Rhodothermus sp.]
MYPCCSFQEVDCFYEVLSRRVSIRRRNVACREIEHLWEVICILRREEEVEIAGKLRRVYSTVQSTPLPPRVAIDLHGIREVVDGMSSEFKPIVEEVLEELEKLEISPYMELLNELREAYPDMPVVAGRWVQAKIGMEVSNRFPDIHFIREPRPLKRLGCMVYEMICVLGPVVAEKQWILEVPPASRVIWMHLGRIRIPGFPRRLLIRGIIHLPGEEMVIPPENAGMDAMQDDDEYSAGGTLREYTVSCVRVETETGYQIYIPETGKVAVITPDGDVSVIQGRKLQPDDIILLREDTARDVLHEVADYLLKSKGRDPERLRAIHRKWKEKLMERIRTFGFEDVSHSLIEGGIQHASPQNIKNWLDEERIGPGDDEEFKQLLEFLEMDNPEEVIESAHLLRQAHREAGREITKMIRKALQEERFNPAHLKEGARIQLEELPGISICVYVVGHVARGPFEVPSYLIRRPLEE